MNAFTEEQQAILREAFNHVWSRMEGLHADLNDDSLRVSSALEVLTERGLLTDEETDQVMARLHVEGSHEAQQEPLAAPSTRPPLCPWRGRFQYAEACLVD